jgi:exodeoxyribonuclease VII large subunit
MFESNNPFLKQKKGFVQISKNRKIIDLTELKKDDIFELQDFKTSINAKVL